MSNDWTGGLVLVGLLATNALLVAARAALVNSRRTHLAQMAEQGHTGAGLANRVANDSTRLIATVRLSQTLARFSAAGVAGVLWAPPLAQALDATGWPGVAGAGLPWAIVLLALPGGLAVVLLGEVIPEALVRREPEVWAVRLAPLVALLEWLLRPLVDLHVRVSGAVARPLNGQQVPFVTEEEIKTMVDAGEEGGVIEEEEKQMILSIFELGDTLVREVMVPRIDVLAIDVDASLGDAAQALLESGHSRAPVYQDTVDNVVGVIFAKDLLRVWRDGNRGDKLRSLLRPATFVPEAKKAADLLAEMQKQRVHMAIVVDEYGGTAGLVTIEDILEEIVGEIRDEYDADERVPFEHVGDGEYVFDGGIDLDDVNNLLQAELPRETSDTLGGFLYSAMGKVPVAGESLQVIGLELRVEQVTGRRIRKVRVRRLPPAGEPDEGQTV